MPTKVLQADEYPYSAVGVIEAYISGNYEGHGTGSLIGPKLVLTVALCDFIKFSSVMMDLFFIPAPIYKRNGKGFKVKKIHLA